MAEDAQIGIRMPVEQNEKFEAELKKVGMSKSNIIKMFISEWLYKRGVK